MSLHSTRRPRLARGLDLLVLAYWLACACARTGLAQPGSPGAAPPPTVAAAQGDNPQGLTVASKFLIGCDFSCWNAPPQSPCACARSTLHAPAGWSPVQLHVLPLNLSADFSRYYMDSTVQVAPGMPGLDNAPGDGIENTRIFFYAGHAHPTDFQAEFDDVWVQLGQLSVGDGAARYLFMMACNLFAHGPRDPSSPSRDFLHPETFRPASVVSGMAWQNNNYTADVFDRWGGHYGTASTGLRSPLNPGLRLACGGSSQIGAGVYPTHLFWLYSTIFHRQAADAWLVGLYAPGSSEPLCISRGDSLVDSGLSDVTFDRDPLVSQVPGHPKKIFIEYPVPGIADTPLNATAFELAPARIEGPPLEMPVEAPSLPVIKVGAETPSILSHVPFFSAPQLGYGFHGGSVSVLLPNLVSLLRGADVPFMDSAVHGDDLCLQQHELNKSVVLSWRPPPPDPSATRKKDLDVAADALSLGLLHLMRLADPLIAHDSQGVTARIVPHDTLAVQLTIDEVLADQPAGREAPARSSGCLYQRQTTAVRYQGGDVQILGEGGERLLVRCPADNRRAVPGGGAAGVCQRSDVPLVTFVYNGRVATGTRSSVQKTEEEAEAMAKAKLPSQVPNVAAYRIVGRRWGYRAAPAHCTQTEMYLVYQFDFASTHQATDGSAPLTIEVPAHDLGGKARIEDTWDCSPEQPS